MGPAISGRHGESFQAHSVWSWPTQTSAGKAFHYQHVGGKDTPVKSLKGHLRQEARESEEHPTLGGKAKSPGLPPDVGLGSGAPWPRDSTGLHFSGEGQERGGLGAGWGHGTLSPKLLSGSNTLKLPLCNLDLGLTRSQTPEATVESSLTETGMGCSASYGGGGRGCLREQGASLSL